jgi:alkanesulfonate monooxygenase SsuD/methylene tetrahydromethanopterin reductase-like flavin-dependent oxidoreductase (luciferase family)
MNFLGENKFKFGVFGLNCANGMTPSRAPERWRAEWPEIVEVAKLADESGVEFLLPIAKWHGLGGEANMWGRSFETFTQAAALGALTRRTGIFVTAHVSLITPAFAAKAIATIDHVSYGRAGLNIVCGWNPDEFSPHGIKLDGERRYDRGLEWFRIYDKLLDGGPSFDWKGEFFDMQGLSTDPLPLQGRPPVMSAAQSGDGQAFAAQAADILFTSMHSEAQVVDTLGRFRQMAAGHGRKPLVCVETQLVCKPTRKEAEDYAYYYAVEMADPDAHAYFARQKATTASKSTRDGATASDVTISRSIEPGAGRRYPGMFPGIHPIIGTPDDLVSEFLRLSRLGVDGSTLVFLNYAKELPFFVSEVLPRMERAGLRNPVRENVM